MARWFRVLLTIIAAGLGAWAGLMVIGGGAAGMAWIFLFGDDPWPRWSEIVIPLVALAGAVGGAAVLGFAAWCATGNDRS